MPIYDFKCEKCGKKKDELQKFEDPPPDCDVVEHGPMTKENYMPGTRKGGGLYSLNIGEKPDRMKGIE